MSRKKNILSIITHVIKLTKMEGKRLTETVIYEVEQCFYDGCGKNQCETTKNVFPIVKKTNRLPRLINLNDIQKKISRGKVSIANNLETKQIEYMAFDIRKLFPITNPSSIF